MNTCTLGHHDFVPNRMTNRTEIVLCFGKVHVYRGQTHFIIDCSDKSKCLSLWIKGESAALEEALFHAVEVHVYQ